MELQCVDDTLDAYVDVVIEWLEQDEADSRQVIYDYELWFVVVGPRYVSCQLRLWLEELPIMIRYKKGLFEY